MIFVFEPGEIKLQLCSDKTWKKKSPTFYRGKASDGGPYESSSNKARLPYSSNIVESDQGVYITVLSRLKAKGGLRVMCMEAIVKEAASAPKAAKIKVVALMGGYKFIGLKPVGSELKNTGLYSAYEVR